MKEPGQKRAAPPRACPRLLWQRRKFKTVSQHQPPAPDSSEARWERIERNLDRAAERQDRTDQQLGEQASLAKQHREEFEQFQQTMRAVIESLHQNDLQLNKTMKAIMETNKSLAENHTLLSGLAAEHHDRIDKLEGG